MAPTSLSTPVSALPPAAPVAREHLTRAFAVCSRLTARHSSTFHLGARLFRGDQHKAVVSVYAACRLGDDAVDEAPGPREGRARLDAWWEGIERAYDGVPREDAAVEVALAWAVRRFPIPLSAFAELREGFDTDLAGARFESHDDLMTYAYRVAGVVGLLIAPIAGYRGGEATLARAVALGQAMQLTNVLRDVGEDLRQGRCYLPTAMLQRHGVDLDDLRAGRVSPAYVALLDELAAEARRLYREGWRGIASLRGGAAPAVAVAAWNYEAILHKIVQNGHDNLRRRAHLRPGERLATIPRALLRLMTMPSRRGRPTPDDDAEPARASYAFVPSTARGNDWPDAVSSINVWVGNANAMPASSKRR
ncbi:MAG: phytoene/squalene synthase family protein [Trueperaceae bacterium]